MAWQDRLLTAKYTAPSGASIEFDYEDVSRSVDKKTGEFTFPNSNGSFIQDSGSRGRRYPVESIFWGDDYDFAAQSFEDLLSEIGPGVLNHPLYGTFDVIPSGTITRRDNLKTGGNQATVAVTFIDVTGAVYDPTGRAYDSSQGNPSAGVIAAVDEYNTAAADQFAENVDTDKTSALVSLKNGYLAAKDVTTNVLDKIAETKAAVEKIYNAVNDSINNGIDTYIGRPLDLAFQTAILIQAPARATALIRDRLDSYGNLAESIYSQLPFTPTLDGQANNKFRVAELYGSTFVSGQIVSVINNEFETKTEAIESAAFILEQMDQITEWRDDNFESLGEIDTGESYRKLQEAVAICVGFLVEISFSLKQERNILLDRDRSIIELCGELYGSLETHDIDFFINSNNLSGDEILELKAGREIVYYV